MVDMIRRYGTHRDDDEENLDNRAARCVYKLYFAMSACTMMNELFKDIESYKRLVEIIHSIQYSAYSNLGKRLEVIHGRKNSQDTCIVLHNLRAGSLASIDDVLEGRLRTLEDGSKSAIFMAEEIDKRLPIEYFKQMRSVVYYLNSIAVILRLRYSCLSEISSALDEQNSNNEQDNTALKMSKYYADKVKYLNTFDEVLKKAMFPKLPCYQKLLIKAWNQLKSQVFQIAPVKYWRKT